LTGHLAEEALGGGVDPYAMEAMMGRYLDDLLCRS
jgi:hypothetical protein